MELKIFEIADTIGRGFLALCAFLTIILFIILAPIWMPFWLLGKLFD